MRQEVERMPAGVNGETKNAGGRASSDMSNPPDFVHLHVHTHYSLLDGATRIPALVARCKALGMPAVAISDHGNMFGAIEFYQAAIKAGIKPIIGCELYIAPHDRTEKRAATGGLDSAYHLLVLATDLAGYRNLIKLASIGYLEGFYRKPRIDKEVLAAHSAGLICTSTCLGGEVPQAFIRKDMAEAKRLAETYLKIFGPDRFFIELQNHGIADQIALNPELNTLAKRLGVATIATNDVHYLEHDDAEAHDVLCCINTRSLVSDEKRFRFEADQFYFKSPREMATALPDYPEALANTLRVADMCNVELDFSKRYAPVYKTPKGRTADGYLRELVLKGAEQRYGEITPELLERIDYELGVISEKGFSGYFLIVWDVVNWCAAHDIPAQARGSGCSTVVGYCLRISHVEPLRYGLYFERFMDPERDEMPDIDLDICQSGRQSVIDHVRQKYGHVAQIITFGTLKARAAIRDVCRAMNISLSEADRVAKLVPEELKMTLETAMKREPELRRLYEQEPKWTRVLDTCKRIEGLARHASVHAAGVVIADVPLDTLVPLYKPADSDDVITQFDGPTVEKVGLLKMDFLGLRTLSQIALACKMVSRHHGVTIDLEQLDLTDRRVYELLTRGETKGVFQFESGGMRDVLMKMKPNRIEDLIAANALFRPGPMQYINDYVARKHGRVKWETPHPAMTEVLSETYGIMVYQEQVSRLVNRLGGVPLRRAFRLAKAISKKKTEMINAEREPFLNGCEKEGVERGVAEQIFEDILRFGGYAFNKAHSAGYALLAFQTAYLKTYYPAEFMAALMTYESGNSGKIAEYLHDCRYVHQRDGSTGIEINPPDVNESEMGFTVVYESRGAKDSGIEREGAEREGAEREGAEREGAEGQGAKGSVDRDAKGRATILFGLSAIGGLGVKAVGSILDARGEGGRFRDIYDFCERVELGSVNKSAIEGLIKAGAFDRTGAMRRALIEILPGAIEHGQAAQRDLRSGQMSMFGDMAGSGGPPAAIPSSEWTEAELLMHEKQTLGFYITKHPLTQHESLIKRFGTATTADIKRMAASNGHKDTPARGYGRSAGPQVIVGGLISQVRNIAIRNGRSAGKKMAVILLEDLVGSIEAIVFPDNLSEFAPLMKPDSVVFISAEIDTRREEPCLRVAKITPVEQAEQDLSKDLVVYMDSTGDPDERLPALRTLCGENPGHCQLYFKIASPGGWTATVDAGDNARVATTRTFLDELQTLVGPGNFACIGRRGAFSSA